MPEKNDTSTPESDEPKTGSDAPAPEVDGSKAEATVPAPESDESKTEAEAPAETPDVAALEVAVPMVASESEGQVAADTKSFKTLGIVAGAILGSVVFLYFVGCLLFATHFYPNTKMGPLDVSWMSQKRAADALEKQASRYQLNVEGEGLSFAVAGNTIKLNLDEARIASQALKSNNVWEWPVRVFGAHDATKYLAATYDKTALAQLVESQVQLVNATATQPTNATILFDANVGTFQVTPEQLGTMLDQSSVEETVGAAIATLKPNAEITEEELLQPTITTKDTRLDDACAAANTMIKTNLTLAMGGSQVAQLGPQEIAGWIQLGDDMSVNFNDAAFDGWIEGIVDGCNTVGTQRTYTRPDGKVVTVKGGSYGWKIDSDAFRNAIRESMTAGQTGTFEIPVTQEGTGFEGIGNRDWGKKYCDIDLSEQYARFYDDSGTCVWESAIVSGKPNGHGTPTGVYKINSGKSSPATLTGQILPGTTEPEYVTKVSYWMPFIRNSIGLHDATWQSSFGGNRYSTGFGSHGCINLPLSKAKELYSLISVGDPVITHY